jgi:recombination protein RecT
MTNASAPKGNEGLRNQTGLTPQNPQDRISAMIRAELPRMQRLIQNPSMAKRFGQLAMNEMRKNPALFDCEPMTVLGCLMTAASLGLQIGVGGQAYLIPYKDRSANQTICTFVPGWRGLMALMLRSGNAEAQTGVAREGDTFRFSLGTDPYIEHVVNSERDAKITHFYAWGRSEGSKYPVVEVWTVKDIERHLAKFNKVGGNHYALKGGKVNFEMYGRKVPLLQVLKYMPANYELDTAMELDGKAEAGVQTITPNEVMESAALPPPAAVRDPNTDDPGPNEEWEENPDAEPAQ